MKDAPLRTIQPVAVPAQFFTCGTLASAFFALFPGFFSGLITMAITDKPGPSLGVGFVVYVTTFILVMSAIGWSVYSGPRATSYRVYRDRIEIDEGLLNRKQRTVLIGGVIDVSLTEGVLQRTQSAGTVTLIIRPAMTQVEGTIAQQSVSLTNVPQPQAVYDLIRSLALDRRTVSEPSTGHQSDFSS